MTPKRRCQFWPHVISSALAKRVGQWEVGGCATLGDCAWELLQLPVEKLWSMPSAFLHEWA